MLLFNSLIFYIIQQIKMSVLDFDEFALDFDEICYTGVYHQVA